MKRALLAVLVPPLAVCRYGCASCCAAPIAVFWVTAIISLVYGYFGGPLHLLSINWYTELLGVGLWGIASVWAMVTIGNVDADQCEKKTSALCGKILPTLDESDPMEEARKAQ